jgi:hypothetical protein
MVGTKQTMFQLLRPISLFITCCAAVGIILFMSGRTRQTKEVRQEKPSAAKVPDELTFRGTAIFDGRTEDGAQFAEHFYKSSDCVSISEEIIFFKSTSRAQRELESRSKKASIVNERGPQWEDKGQAGERIVLELADNSQAKGSAEIIWNSGSTFHSIVGPSLHYVLEFEKSLRLRDGRITRGMSDLRNLTFSTTRSSEGTTEQGIAYSEKQIESSDCEMLKTRTEYFDSPAQALEEFTKKLKQAINVIEQGPKTNSAGQRVGERAVAALKAETSDESLDQSIVMWTDGSQYHSIKGRFPHVLEFEKRNQGN